MPIILTPWRSLLRLAVTLAALLTCNALVTITSALAQEPAPADQTSAQPQPPPIQARPGAPEGTPRTDQTIDVVKGTRLLLTNNAGEVIVRTWDRDAVRVQANHSMREQIDIQTAESALRVRGRAQRGANGLVDYRVTVPTWMPVSLTGTYLEADVAGTSAEVTVETVGGNVKVSGGSGAVSVRSVEGTITVEKTTGSVKANAVNEGIHLTNTQGEVVAESINGDVIIDNAQTSSLEVSTVNGDVTFNGSVRESGVYRLTTHGGDMRVGLGGAANAIVFVRTFKGDFSADFPIQLPDGQSDSRGSKRFNFTLGAGSARIELQSFNGDIHLARATVTSDDKDMRRRRMGVPRGVPLPPTPPAAPKPPKPPKPPKGDLDFDLDLEALTDLARLQVDEMRTRINPKALNKMLKDMDDELGHVFDEGQREALEESLREFRRMVPAPPRLPK